MDITLKKIYEKMTIKELKEKLHETNKELNKESDYPRSVLEDMRKEIGELLSYIREREMLEKKK